MRRVVTHATIWLVLAVCLLCTAMQMFDTWDHELQTGQDTESTVFVFALCVGATFVVLKAAVKLLQPSRSRRTESADNGFSNLLEASVYIPAAATLFPSPPVNLRI